MSEPRFFDPYADIEKHHNILPHWQQYGATYFITFRLEDAIPATLLSEWKTARAVWMKHHPQPWTSETEREYHERFSRQIDAWLDAGQGECYLRSAAHRRFLIETLRYGDGLQYTLHAWVIMPNHAHVLVSLAPGRDLEVEVGAWKSISARRINRNLERSGALWQEDYFDRLIRNEQHFANCIRYIVRNPEKAKLGPAAYDLYSSDFARTFTE